MLFSKQFIQTLREVPSDTKTISHILALRSSIARQHSHGGYLRTEV